jgi:glycosyltransferase involved in cell wall biosynthesis
MRIAMISEHASPLAVLGGVDAGGQNVHVAALSVALAARGHRVTVYTRRDSPALAPVVPLAPGVDVVHVPAGPPAFLPKDDLPPYMPEFGDWLAAHWRLDGIPDVVHAHFWMSGVAALRAARDLPVPVVQTFHALGTVKRRHQGDRDTSPADRIATETSIATEVDLVIATCSDEVNELKRMGISSEKINVVPCGVDTSLFTPLHSADFPTGRQRTAPTLLSVGRLVERKGVDTVIEALTMLPGVELIVAGGPDSSALDADPEAIRLSELATALAVDDRVQLLGRVSHGELPSLMRSCDLVVCTPTYEPFGIVPIEAAACGKAVVGSAVGGLLDTVCDGRTGALVKPNNPAAVADAVRDLLADEERRHRFEVAARLRALTLYDWSSVSAATATAYLSLVQAPRAEVPA